MEATNDQEDITATKATVSTNDQDGKMTSLTVLVKDLAEVNAIFEKTYLNTPSRVQVKALKPKDPRGGFRVVATENIAVGECFMIEAAEVFFASINSIAASDTDTNPMFRDFLLYGSTEAMRRRELATIPDDIELQLKSPKVVLTRDPTAVNLILQSADTLEKRLDIARKLKDGSRSYILYRSIEESILLYLDDRFGAGNEDAQRAFLCTFAVSPADRIEKPYDTLSIKDLAELVLDRNALPLSLDSARVSYGKGLFPISARINHSCDPNSTHFSHGRYNVCYAMRSIAKGEEITNSYVGDFVKVTRDARRQLLRERLNFDCVCERCGREKNFVSMSNTRNTQLNKMLLEEYNLAQRWRYTVYKTLGEYDARVASFGEDRQKGYRLTTMYLQQHAQKLIAIPDEHYFAAQIREFVVAACASMLLVTSCEDVLKNPRHWLECFEAVQPVMMRSISEMAKHKVNTINSIRWGEALVNFAMLLRTYVTAGKPGAVERLAEGDAFMNELDHSLDEFREALRALPQAPTALSSFLYNQHAHVYRMAFEFDKIRLLGNMFYSLATLKKKEAHPNLSEEAEASTHTPELSEKA